MIALILNVIWVVLGGFLLFLGWLLAAALMVVTIIGIPLAWAHLKLAGVSLFPIGKAIVDTDVAAEMRRRRAAGIVDQLGR